MRKMRKVPPTPEKQGSEEIPQSKTPPKDPGKFKEKIHKSFLESRQSNLIFPFEEKARFWLKRCLGYRRSPNYYPRRILYFELIRRGVIYDAVIYLPRIIVLEIRVRRNSAACYVEKPRLGASGIKNDAGKSHQNSCSAG